MTRKRWGYGILTSMKELRASVEWRDGHLEVIDQTALPARLEVRRLETVAGVVAAIREMVVRGAPVIGVCGAFAMVLGLGERKPATAAGAHRELELLSAEIGAARPTAVNLSWAVRRVAEAAARGGTVEEVRRLALAQALRIQEEDRESCRRIADFGRAELARVSRVMTHCNTGRLATGGIGTAFGVIVTAHEQGKGIDVIACEARPLRQGSRLTAWELAQAGIPARVIVDKALELAR